MTLKNNQEFIKQELELKKELIEKYKNWNQSNIQDKNELNQQIEQLRIEKFQIGKQYEEEFLKI